MACPTGLLDGVREVSVEDLLNELNEVTDKWFDLGIHLEIPDYKLKEIHQENEDVKDCMIEMILVWKQLCIPTWKAMVAALAEIDMRSLAIKIASKYG